jgi:hypothetical protein
MLSLILPWLAIGGATDPSLSLASSPPAPSPEVTESENTAPDSGETFTNAANALQELAEELGIGALLRMSLDVSTGDAYETIDGNGDSQDSSGVRFEDAQAWLDTFAGPFEVFFMAKAADANAFPPLSNGSLTSFDLRDAWIRTELAERFNIYGGQFKCPLVASGTVGYDSLIMIDRTRIGQLFSASGAYQPGVAVTFDSEMLHGKLAVQNGADGIIDEYGVVARGELKLNGGARHREGALDAVEGLAGTFGLGYFTDGSQVLGDDFGSAIALDGYLTLNQLSVHAEILDMDEELAFKAVNNLTNPGDDATAYSLTGGFLFAERWEAAARLQGLDDDLDTTLITGGLNYYQDGHGLKYQFNLSSYDDDNNDGVIAQFGVTLGVGAPNAGCATCRG